MTMENHIKNFWENQAKLYKDQPAASWGDNFAIDLEIENIGAHIKEGDVVLDVGCANGFAAIRQLADRRPSKIIGIDFSENMIKNAQLVREKHGEKEKLDFLVGDILKIEYDSETFDVVYTTRVLINLPTWEQQILGIKECLRVTKKGGKVIFSEAFWEPLVLMNSLRTLLQLSPLIEHDFNRYIKKSKLESYLTQNEINYSCNDFSSVYYLGSRFVRDLVTDIDSYPGYSNPINEIFYNIETRFSGGGFGIQQAYIIDK